jgi:predicted ATPase
LLQENNTWRLGDEKICVPLKIRDIIIQRLARLNNAQKRVLDAASVIGNCFEAGLLSVVVEQDTLEVLETLNIITHATSLILADESQYRFDHARSREIIYESLSQPLKQGYHKKIAETLENTKSKNLPFSELAHHYAQAGNNEKAVKYALEAGSDALLKWSNSEAIKHFQYALKNLPKEKSEVKIAVALDGLGDAYKASCMYDEAMKAFDALAESTMGASRLRAIRKAMDAAYDQGSSPDLLLKYARKAEEVGGNDRLEMARIIDNRAKAWAWSGRGDAKMDLADYNARSSGVRGRILAC